MKWIIKKIRKYHAIYSISLSETFVYVADFLGKSIFFFVIISIFSLLWKTIYQGSSSASATGMISGFTQSKMIWYLIFSEILMLSGSNFYSEVSEDVKTGNISYLLNKPYHYVWYQFANNLGKSSIYLVRNLIVGLLIGLVLVGPLDGFKLYNLPVILLFLLSGLILDFFINFTLALSAFWVEENIPFRWIYQKLVFVLGGMLLPLDLLPEPIRNISSYLPFAFVSYAPAKLAVAFNEENLLYAFIGQGTYIGIVVLIAFGLYRKGASILNVNGG